MGQGAAGCCSACLPCNIPIMATPWARPGSLKALVKGRRINLPHTQQCLSLEGSWQPVREQVRVQGEGKGEREEKTEKRSWGNLSGRSFLEHLA